MIRALGLRGAIAVNVITMIGIGPLITIPLVLAQLHGSLALAGWLIGALIAFCDGLVWAELGSLFPGSGGTYVFLRDAFGRERAGRPLAFLFAWQTVLSAPLLLATGYIGFAQYAGYLWPALTTDARAQGLVAASVGVLTLALLYRRIGAVASIGIALAGVSIATLVAVILAGATHFSAASAFSFDRATPLGPALLAGLGPALVITLYDYYGYGQACVVSDEVRDPSRVLPRAIVLSLALVGALYVALQIAVLGVVPWHELVPATPGGAAPPAAGFVASTVVERVWGSWPAKAVTLAVLATAFASTFGNLLGYSRVPYAAANDGLFLRPFARLHETGRFPTVALATIGLLALPACFFSLGDVIAALTAGLVIVQGLVPIVALFWLRAHGSNAPYRMWLFPLPALVAAAGWCYIFYSAGGAAVTFGLVTLAAGCAVYAWRARLRREWPFALKGAAVVAFGCGAALLAGAPVEAAGWGSSAIVERHGFPVFTVEGKPFFVYGAAFFYERLPRSNWDASMSELRELGVNTLDLYVPWNWHELADGDFDFDGRTSPRRDLDEVLRLARAHGFKLILRPGPVVRNEWRNGGYPAWLLQRPEYGMPLHDLLEGRYPPTATLQNVHSDEAAAEWLSNATHLLFAKRWLERVLHEVEPDADLVLGVALDDDQGAYIDNQTWPAPHLQAYLKWLEGVVHGVTGPLEPVFINTYQMKVTASSPVWAMGNWYQSDAYAIGEHDRAQLEFSTGLLATRPRQPMMLSEFQAGWLEQPDDIRPRPADPSNTALAMATAIGMGVRGIVSFPLQDTLYPSGMEAPFANAFYAWDAALGLDLTHQPRWWPVAALGATVGAFNAQLAAARPLYDADVAYLTSAYDERTLSNDDVAAIAARTIALQSDCREASLACRLVDLRYAPLSSLARHALLLLPVPPGELGRRPFVPEVRAKLSALARDGVRIVRLEGALDRARADELLRGAGRRRLLEGTPGATVAVVDGDPHVFAFLTVANYRDSAIETPGALHLGTRTLPLARFSVEPRSALIVALSRTGRQVAPEYDAFTYAPERSLSLPVRRDAALRIDRELTPPAGSAVAYRADAYEEGNEAVVLENALVRVIVAPLAGARAFIFQDRATHRNVFTSVGALRDDVALEPPLSTSDRIARYTHQFPAGTFNRPYDATIVSSGSRAAVRFSYDAPDVLPAGAHFERTLALEPGARTFSVDEVATFASAQQAPAQRAVSVTSLAVGESTTMKSEVVLSPEPSAFTPATTLPVHGNALGYYDAETHELATVAWRPGDVESADVLERSYSIVVRLTLAPGRSAHSEYGSTRAPSLEAARSELAAAARACGEGRPVALANSAR